MFVGVVNGKWIVDGKSFNDMTRKDKNTLYKVMQFKKEAYQANYKSKIIK